MCSLIRFSLRIAVPLFLLSACGSFIPSGAPPQLHRKTGSFIIITDSHVEAGDFRFDYPASWRVVKESMADEAWMRLVLVAPDGSAIYLRQVESGNAAPREGLLFLDGGGALQFDIRAADERDSSAFKALADQVLSSIRSG